MRDAHRMKEKLDLSLDSRQLVALTAGALVVLGGVFVLGLMVGKSMKAGESAAQEQNLLAAIDEKSAAHLTFQEELTRPPPVAPPPPREEPKPVEIAKPADPKAPEAPKPTEAKPSDLKPSEPKVETKAPVAKPDPVRADPPAPPRAETPKASAPVETAVRTADAGGALSLKDGFAKSQRPTEAVPNGAYTLQLSASQDRAEADRFAARLRDRGYAPYIVEAHVPEKGTWYRVRMGSFASKEAANRYLADFQRETQLKAFVAGTN
jgi:DedD protein